MEDSESDGGSEMGTSATEAGIPKSALHKLQKQVVPEARVSGELRDLFAACCNSFVRTVARKADALMTAQRKTILTPDHVLAGMSHTLWLALLFSA